MSVVANDLRSAIIAGVDAAVATHPASSDPLQRQAIWQAISDAIADKVNVGVVEVQSDGTTVGTKPLINFTGAGVSVAIVDDKITVTISGGGSGGSGPSPSDATPHALGTAAPGSSADYSRADHVHAMPSAASVGADPAGTAATAVLAEATARMAADSTLTTAVGNAQAAADNAQSDADAAQTTADNAATAAASAQVTANSAQSLASGALQRTGGTMSGAIHMANNAIDGLPAASSNGQPVRYDETSSTGRTLLAAADAATARTTIHAAKISYLTFPLANYGVTNSTNPVVLGSVTLDPTSGLDDALATLTLVIEGFVQRSAISASVYLVDASTGLTVSGASISITGTVPGAAAQTANISPIPSTQKTYNLVGYISGGSAPYDIVQVSSAQLRLVH